jgi:hypothetical protein
MNFPSEASENRAAIRARQRAYLASLDSQVAHKSHAAAHQAASDGRFVRDMPATPDEAVLLAPLPPVADAASPRRVGAGLKKLRQQPLSQREIEDGRRRYGKAYETGVGAALGGDGYGEDPAVEDTIGFAMPPSPGQRKNYMRQQQQQQQQNPGLPGPSVNLNYGNAQDASLLQAAVAEQLNRFNSVVQRNESTVKWLSEQLAQSRSDAAKHSALLVNQHTKDSEQIAGLRDRLRTMETEVLESRSWRSQFERRKNESVESAASAALAELQAREQDYKLRMEADENRARRMAEQMAEMASRLESVRQSQAKGEDEVQARLGVVENSVCVQPLSSHTNPLLTHPSFRSSAQTDKLVNLVDRETDASIINSTASESNSSALVDLQNALKQMQARVGAEEAARRCPPRPFSRPPVHRSLTRFRRARSQGARAGPRGHAVGEQAADEQGGGDAARPDRRGGEQQEGEQRGRGREDRIPAADDRGEGEGEPGRGWGPDQAAGADAAGGAGEQGDAEREPREGTTIRYEREKLHSLTRSLSFRTRASSSTT